MHFCADELLAIAAALPFVGAALAWLRSQVSAQDPLTTL